MLPTITKIIVPGFLFPVIIAISLLTNNGNSFKLSAHLKGFADSTLFFLCDMTESTFKTIDSAYVIGNKLMFKGSLKEGVMKAALRSKDYNDRCYFWLENTDIDFIGEKGKFPEAVIKGCKVHEEQQKMNLALKGIKDTTQFQIGFIQKNPSSIISAELLSIYCTAWGRDTTSMLFEDLSQKNKTSFYGKNISAYLALNKNLKLGDRYADFSQADINGNIIKISSFEGKVILLDFWGSWCVPCRKANPELKKIYAEYKEKGFEIVGIAADNNKDFWLQAVSQDGLPWTNVCDMKGNKNEAALIYGVSYYPANFLIDRSGIIIAKDLEPGTLKQKLKELLAQN